MEQKELTKEELHNIKMKEYREKNKDKIKLYRETHKEQIKTFNQQYYNANKEKLIAEQKERNKLYNKDVNNEKKRTLKYICIECNKELRKADKTQHENTLTHKNIIVKKLEEQKLIKQQEAENKNMTLCKCGLKLLKKNLARHLLTEKHLKNI